MMDRSKALAATLSALAHETRLDLIRLDIQPEAERLCTDAARQMLMSEPYLLNAGR